MLILLVLQCREPACRINLMPCGEPLGWSWIWRLLPSNNFFQVPELLSYGCGMLGHSAKNHTPIQAHPTLNPWSICMISTWRQVDLALQKAVIRSTSKWTEQNALLVSQYDCWFTISLMGFWNTGWASVIANLNKGGHCRGMFTSQVSLPTVVPSIIHWCIHIQRLFRVRGMAQCHWLLNIYQ